MTNTNGTREILLLALPSPLVSRLRALAREHGVSTTQLGAELLAGTILDQEEQE